MAAEAGITRCPVAIEEPNDTSVGERYHAPLRKTFLKLQESYGVKPLSEGMEVRRGPRRPRKGTKKVYRELTADDDYLLAISVMCINLTVVPEGSALHYLFSELCRNSQFLGVHLPLDLKEKE